MAEHLLFVLCPPPPRPNRSRSVSISAPPIPSLQRPAARALRRCCRSRWMPILGQPHTRHFARRCAFGKRTPTRRAACVLRQGRGRLSGSSMKRSIAHGPASKRRPRDASESSSQKHIAERNVECAVDPKSASNVNGSTCATLALLVVATTVLVVPKSRPSANDLGVEEAGIGQKVNAPPCTLRKWGD